MAESWVTWEEFEAENPGLILEPQFPRLAAEAALTIEDATGWRAAIADDEISLAALRRCQSTIIADHAKDASVDASIGTGAVTSASNDGYSESYASRATLVGDRKCRDTQTIDLALGAPATRWMIYAGGVYHPVARR